MESHLHALLGYLSAHAGLALVAVFAGALLEALAVIGTFIPGSTLVFLGGALAGLGVLHPLLVAAAAIVGAILGDGSSFWLGHRYRDRIRSMWPLQQHPALLERGRVYFETKGRSSIFLGRFIGPLRAIVPVVAGMSDMPSGQFYVMNVLSSFAWVAAHMLPGMAFGASLQIAGAVSWRLLVLVLVLAALLWVLIKLLHVLRHRGASSLRVLRDKSVAWASTRHSLIAKLVLSLLDPARPESSALLTGTIVLIGSAWLFLGVLQDIRAGDPLVLFDPTVSAFFKGIRTEGADRVMGAIAEAGSPIGTAALVVVIALVLSLLRYWHTLGYWLTAAGVAEILEWTLEWAVAGKRPETVYTGIAHDPLTSGHLPLSVVVYGFLAFLLARRKLFWQRIVITVIATIVILLISSSRLYLGMHWFSVAIASLSLGLASVAILGICYTRHAPREPLRALPLAALCAATLALAAGTLISRDHATDVLRYRQPAPAQSMSLAAWTAGGWRQLPRARSELGGDVEEPFSVQWAASAKRLEALDGTGWHTPNPWSAKSLLLWLLPSAPIQELPVVPKFDHGRVEDFIFARDLDADRRLVLRLWKAPVSVILQPGNAAVPLWYGMATLERLRRHSAIGTLPGTSSDFVMPRLALQRDAIAGGLSTAVEGSGNEAVVLIW